MDSDFLIKQSELTLRFQYPEGKRQLAFAHAGLPFSIWQQRAKNKLAEMLHLQTIIPGNVRELRQRDEQGIRWKALVMDVDGSLSLPAYLLEPLDARQTDSLVLALHGHGEVEACLGMWEDYHHQFAVHLAQQGYRVFCPELRGFGTLFNMAADLPGERLDYWQWGHHMAFSLVTDGFQKGRSLIGTTVEDLLRWEQWLINTQDVRQIQVIGISYGGDLALLYPVFSSHVSRIFASGTLGSFQPIFSRCYNAPAHCIPNILEWLDRADIAGLNAPRPLLIHYGSLDTPGPDNASASYNGTVHDSFKTLQSIYAAASAEKHVSLAVSSGKGHEMDLELLSAFLTSE